MHASYNFDVYIQQLLLAEINYNKEKRAYDRIHAETKLPFFGLREGWGRDNK